MIDLERERYELIKFKEMCQPELACDSAEYDKRKIRVEMWFKFLYYRDYLKYSPGERPKRN